MEKSRWDGSPQLWQPREISSRIKEKRGRGSAGPCKASEGGSQLLGKLLHPCPVATARVGTRRLPRRIPRAVHKQKKLLKKLGISADQLFVPAGESWGRRRSVKALVGQWALETYNRSGWLRGAGQAAGAGAASQGLPGAAAVRFDQELPPPGRGQAVSEGGETLGQVRGRSGAAAVSPHTPMAVPHCPAPVHPGLGPPKTVNLLPTGRGTSKPGHFNIRAAREREGRLEETGRAPGP